MSNWMENLSPETRVALRKVFREKMVRGELPGLKLFMEKHMTKPSALGRPVKRGWIPGGFFWFILILVLLGIGATVIEAYVIAHFITKYW